MFWTYYSQLCYQARQGDLGFPFTISWHRLLRAAGWRPEMSQSERIKAEQWTNERPVSWSHDISRPMRGRLTNKSIPVCLARGEPSATLVLESKTGPGSRLLELNWVLRPGSGPRQLLAGCVWLRLHINYYTQHTMIHDPAFRRQANTSQSRLKHQTFLPIFGIHSTETQNQYLVQYLIVIL